MCVTRLSFPKRRIYSRRHPAELTAVCNCHPDPRFLMSPSLLHRCVTLIAFAASFLSARAMSVVPPTFDELVGVSELIVRGEVTGTRSAYVDTPQGRAIKTFVTFRVERVLKGTPPTDDNLTLVFLGGKVGAASMEVAGMPAFQPGDREIVFVSGNGRTLCPLIAAGHGRYRLLRDAASNRDFVARENRVPLESTAEVQIPLQSDPSPATRMKSAASALSPSDFESKIAEAVLRLGPGVPAQK